MVPLLVIGTILLFLGMDAILLYARRRHMVPARPAPDAIWNPGMGWTMADGGEPIEEKKEEETK